MIKLLGFTIYYIQKRGAVLLGWHRTRNPLSLRWRWRYWNDNYEEIRKTARQRTSLSKGKPEGSF